MSGSADTPETQAQGALFDPDRLQSLERPPCDQCGGALSGKQTRFCSKGCGTTWYTSRHPRIAVPIPPAEPRGIPIRDRILGIMVDGRWYTDLELATALGEAQSTVSAKRRDLKKKPLFYRFEERVATRAYSRKAWEYRLVKP